VAFEEGEGAAKRPPAVRVRRRDGVAVGSLRLRGVRRLSSIGAALGVGWRGL